MAGCRETTRDAPESWSKEQRGFLPTSALKGQREGMVTGAKEDRAAGKGPL